MNESRAYKFLKESEKNEADISIGPGILDKIKFGDTVVGKDGKPVLDKGNKTILALNGGWASVDKKGNLKIIRKDFVSGKETTLILLKKEFDAIKKLK